MNEDFVSFELAKKLKEKGFIGDVDTGMHCGFYYKEGEDIEIFYDNCDNADVAADEYLRPTISQVLKWLRDDKGYHIEFVGNACGYLFIVSDIPSKGGTDRHCSDYDGPNDGGCWDSYEAAAIAGIEYVLDNLI